MHRAVALLALSSVGCGSLLGLDDFTDVAPAASSTTGSGAAGAAGGAGGSGGGMGAAGGGGSGGTGGGGGERPSLDCENVGVDFEVFTAAEVGSAEIDERFHLVPDGDRIHVVVIKVDGTGVLARTVKDSDPGPIATWVPPMFSGAPRIAAGYRAPNDKLRLVAVSANELGYLDFDLQNDEVQPGGAPTFTALPTQPPACTAAGAFFRNVQVAHDGGTPHFAVTCESMGNNQHTLYIGDDLGFTQVDQGPAADNALDVRQYAVTPTHLLVTGDDFGGTTYVRYGTTAAQLAMRHEFKLGNAADDLTGSPTLIPAPMQADGVTVIAGLLGLPPGPLTPADIFTGAIPAADYAHFSDVPPAELSIQATVDEIDDMPLTERFHYNASYITTAGTNVGLDRIFFSYFRRDGTMEIFGQEIYTAPAGVEFLRAFAAPAGLVNVLVTWSEKNGTAYSVRGQRLICG